ncbi:salicylate 5-hydroxylase large subunit [Panacagrimonas perspica]|uniref:Salicylate 5-hydroxylase large subunit n=1 Tax=Panacagrimonas perspica TaxID=381431 RepID=A0A4R7P1G3_9GAMM|nr:aromatic ring-hydroxylating dioxygenase subunit alpha [Panacagrimonas perspica]TDU26690.1 salicylate 5-hydroxylase large subunit [Panacagrimonas perspica]THD04037.1 salicylate hydroxylase [Panacagrimonas perspica]
MNDAGIALQPESIWKSEGTHQVPFAAYTDAEIYQQELRKLFYANHWCYLGLEVEIPNVGDFRRTVVGERSVIMVRNKDGGVSAFENVCAHRGAQFCRERGGNAKGFHCPYHHWNYDLEGNLRGLPFRQGIRQEEQLHGGMPEDFSLKDNGLTKLRVATRGGVVFGSFDHDIESFEDFLGPTVLSYFDRIFNGRKLTLLGYNRQRIPGNWKLMQENIKDPYHPGLLHTWFVNFGLWRADNKTRLLMDAHKRHAVMVGVRSVAKPTADVTKGVASYKESMQLHDMRQLDIVPEPWWNGPTVTMLTLFPSLIIQQQVNSLSTRHIQPRGAGVFDFVWTHFGFEDDTAEMTERRLIQANLFGPSGYVSADDGEVIEFSQMGFDEKPWHRAVIEMGGRDTNEAETVASETLIRGMYAYWRKVMGI